MNRATLSQKMEFLRANVAELPPHRAKVADRALNEVERVVLTEEDIEAIGDHFGWEYGHANGESEVKIIADEIKGFIRRFLLQKAT